MTFNVSFLAQPSSSCVLKSFACIAPLPHVIVVVVDVVAAANELINTFS